MSDLKIGSLFSGYGGLDMAVESVTGARTAWVSDIDKGACKILAHRYPDVPNLGDLTAIDWAAVEPVDIITGGFPCQDLSHAGKRAGMASGTRSGLWSYMAEAIDTIRPRLVVAENVRGLLSAEALRPVEPCTWCVGDEPEFDVRALGAVLADLADIGYDAQWHGICAGLPDVPIDNITHVGAPHKRFRVFLVAYPKGDGWDQGWAESAGLVRRPDAAKRRRVTAAGYLDRLERMTADPVLLARIARDRAKLLPSPRTSDANGAGSHGDGGLDLRTAVSLLPTPTTQDGANTGGASQFDRNSIPLNALVTLLPTPAVNDMGRAYTPDEWDAWTAKMQAAHGNGNGHGKSLEIEAARLLPTPVTTDAKGARNGTSGRREDSDHNTGTTLSDVAYSQTFGEFAGAIARWESVTGLTPPPPTEPTGKGGAHRLSPSFTEFMMGLPDGWITDVPGITRNEALKACGNGVVPQQAAAALRHMLAVSEVAA